MKYKCTDKSRNIFKFLNSDGEINKDVDATKLISHIVDGGIKVKSVEIAKEWYKEREWLQGVDLNVIKGVINNCVNFINENRELYEKLAPQKKEDEKVDDDADEIEFEMEDDDGEETKTNEDGEEEKKKDEDGEDYDSTDEQRNKIKSRYNLENIKLPEKNNPIDFKKFISDSCEEGDEFNVIQSDLKLAFKIWSKTPLEMIEEQFTAFMNDNYKDTRIFIDNQRRHVFKGLKLKPLTYTKTENNFDFEEFIEKECVVDYAHKISYIDFFHFFTEWKQKTDPEFDINKFDKINIKEVLETLFCRGRILKSVQSKTKNLFGILGVGVSGNNYGIVEKKRQNKIVKEYDIETKKVVKEYDSMISCAKQLNIPFSTFGNHVRNQTVIDVGNIIKFKYNG